MKFELVLSTRLVGGRTTASLRVPPGPRNHSRWPRTAFGLAGSSPAAPDCRRCCRCCAEWPSGAIHSRHVYSSVSPTTPKFSRKTSYGNSPSRCRTSGRHPGLATRSTVDRRHGQPRRSRRGRSANARRKPRCLCVRTPAHDRGGICCAHRRRCAPGTDP